MASSWARTIGSAIKRVAISVVVFVVIAEVVLRFLPVQSGLRSLPVNDNDPVARSQPNRTFIFSSGWGMALANRGRVNNAGFVNNQDYDSTLTTPLLAVIGNDDVEAAMVPFDSTIHGRLARLLAGRARVYSFGGSGASVSQILGWADHVRKTYRPSGLVVVVTAGDADHSLLKYWTDRGFYHFVDGPGDSLSLKLVEYQPSPARQLVRESALARYLILNGKLFLAGQVAELTGVMPMNPDPARVRDNEKAIDAFYAKLPVMSGLPPQRIAIVVDGVRPALYSPNAPLTPRAGYERHIQRYFVDQGRKGGFEVIDMDPAFAARFAQDSVRFESPIDHRWNASAHRAAMDAVVKSSIVRELKGDVLDSSRSGPGASTSTIARAAR